MKEENTAGKVLIYLLAGIGVVAAGVMLLWLETDMFIKNSRTVSNADVMQ